MSEAEFFDAGITETPPQPTQNAPAPSTTAGTFDQINSALKNITDALKGANQTKGEANDALSQLQQLLGGGGAQQQAPAPKQGPGILSIVLVGSIIVLGALVVWKIVKRNG